MELKKTYSSPRWTGEIADCSMPVTFDTYGTCSYNCLYCFAFYQKSHTANDYLGRKSLTSVNPERIKKLLNAAAGSQEKLSKADQQFIPYLASRKTMQWGGMADGFDEYERRFGVSLELLKIFDQADYPLSISTKGTWWTEDPRYMDLVKQHGHNWHYKISIITADPLSARAIERGCPAPAERIRAIERLAKAGAPVTLRLRPYMPGISNDWQQLIYRAQQAGADSVTVEWFCLEARADARLKAKYTEMSKFAGIDLWEYYKKHSHGAGYRRLNYEIKRPTLLAMKEYAHSLGLRFYVSDAHGKELSDYCCCCGVPPEWSVSRGHFAEALLIAKRDGTVTWNQIGPELKQIAGAVPFNAASGFNTGSNRDRAERFNQSLYDMVKEWWNNPGSAKSPARYFDGALQPAGADRDGNVIYRYNR